MRHATIVLLITLAAGCDGTPGDQPLAWLAGCWTDGETVERWTLAEGGYLFGGSVVKRDGEVVFFEQMRIEPADSGPVFNAYPKGSGPSAFPLREQGDRSITFANGDHDYPQRITYARDGRELIATISLLDGGNETGWRYRRCR